MKSVRLIRAVSQDRDTIANLMQLYLHDLSEFESESLDARGRFDPGRHLEAYWTEDYRHPFLINVDGELAGFALVREVEMETYSVSEFFIARRFRRSGVGRRAAVDLFDQFRARWWVAQLRGNVPAQQFWRRVISEYTHGRFSEGWSDAEPQGPMQSFDNRQRTDVVMKAAIPADVRMTSQPAAGFVDWLSDRLYEFNSKTTGMFDGEMLVASIERDGRTVAALSGHTWGGCCEITYAWVEEAARRSGLGRSLLEAAESEARRRGCSQIVLSTHSFQAPRFYEKLGFRRVGSVPNYPLGYEHISYLKRLW